MANSPQKESTLLQELYDASLRAANYRALASHSRIETATANYLRLATAHEFAARALWQLIRRQIKTLH